jgi:TfoX/Sxy family transcriptional regulator of competence genes
VHEVRAKAVKLVTGASDSDDESAGSSTPKAAADKSKSTATKSRWKLQGVGPLRLLKHKTTGAVRMLLRAEPRGHVALNKVVLPDFAYKADNKYVKITTATSDGKGLETWMLQVKTAEAANALAAALEEHKVANKK